MRHPGKQAHHESSVCLQDCEIAAPYDSRATEAMMASPREVPANAGNHAPCAIDLNDGAAAFRNKPRQGLWAPACAGATAWAWKHRFAIHVRQRAATSTASRAATVTIACRPSVGGTGESIKLFLANGEAEYFCAKGWTGNSAICPSGKISRHVRPVRDEIAAMSARRKRTCGLRALRSVDVQCAHTGHQATTITPQVQRYILSTSTDDSTPSLTKFFASQLPAHFRP